MGADVNDNLEEFSDPPNYDLEQAAGAKARIAFYSDLAGEVGGPALELACGTGLVTLSVACRGIRTTGVDLCRPMLDEARRKAALQAVDIDWVEADARDLDLGRRFRLVILTGNAFQAFLTRADQDRLLRSVWRHLADDGLFAFETRNPAGHHLGDEPEGGPEVEYVDTDGRFVTLSSSQAWNPVTQVMHWTTWRRWTQGGAPCVRRTHIDCRFTGPDELASLLHDNGLDVVARHGDWDRSPFEPTGPTLIVLCRKLPGHARAPRGTAVALPA